MKRSKEDGWLVGVDLGLAIIVFTVARAGRQRCRVGVARVCADVAEVMLRERAKNW